MHEIADLAWGERTYFGDDTLRTLGLFVRALEAEAKKSGRKPLIGL